MRRLIAWMYRSFFGLQIVSQRQHIIDLEQQLVDHCAEQAALLEAMRQKRVEIDAATERLLDAYERLDGLQQRAPVATQPVAVRHSAGGESVVTS